MLQSYRVCDPTSPTCLAFEMSDDEWQDEYDDEDYFWIEEPDPTVAVSLCARCNLLVNQRTCLDYADESINDIG